MLILIYKEKIMQKYLILFMLFIVSIVSCSSEPSSEKIGGESEWENAFSELVNIKNANSNANSYVAKVLTGSKDLSVTSGIKLTQDISLENNVSYPKRYKVAFDGYDGVLNRRYNIRDVTSILTPDWSLQYTKGFKDYTSDTGLSVPAISYEVSANNALHFTEYVKNKSGDYEWSDWGEIVNSLSMYDEWLELYSILGDKSAYKKSELSNGAYKTKIYVNFDKDFGEEFIEEGEEASADDEASISPIKFSLEPTSENQDYITVKIKFNKDKKVSRIDITDS